MSDKTLNYFDSTVRSVLDWTVQFNLNVGQIKMKIPSYNYRNRNMCLPFFSGQMQNVCRAQGFALFHIIQSYDLGMNDNWENGFDKWIFDRFSKLASMSRSRRFAIIDYRIIDAPCGRGLVHLGNRGFCLFLGICMRFFVLRLLKTFILHKM